MDLKRISKQFSHRLVKRLPQYALTSLVPRDLVVLYYHVVAEKPLPHIRHLYPHKTAIEFEADVIYLKKNYRLPTLEQYFEEAKTPAPRRRQSDRPSVILTFDDGMAECFDLVRPILLHHNVPCVFFITKAFIDNEEIFYRHKVSLCIDSLVRRGADDQARCLKEAGKELGLEFGSLNVFSTWIRALHLSDEEWIDGAGEALGIFSERAQYGSPLYMTSNQIRQLHADGFTIGGHSLRHAEFSELSGRQIESEIVQSCAFASRLLGLTGVPFAFPFSADGVDRNMLQSISDRNPSVTRMFGTGGLAGDAPYLINRIWADPPSGLPAGQSGLRKCIAAAYADQILRVPDTPILLTG